MAKNLYSTIVQDVDDDGREYEGIADAAGFIPGHLVEHNANTDEFSLNAAANLAGSRTVLTEKAASWVGGDVEYSHADNDRLFARKMIPGRVYCIRVVGAVNYTKNLALTSNGDGALKTAATTNDIIARVEEARDLSGELAGTRFLVKVRCVVDEVAP